MGSWLGRVYFPDGTLRYATYSTVSLGISGCLYGRILEVAADTPGGKVVFADVTGEPLPHDYAAPRSDPDDLIAVVIEIEPNHDRWPALYCPRRGMILGPPSYHGAGKLQEGFHLIEIGGMLHLAPDVALGRWENGASDMTLCGLPTAGGAELPFHYAERISFTELPDDAAEPAPPRRDLYSEWDEGRVCRHCLADPRAIYPEGYALALRNRAAIEAQAAAQPRGQVQRAADAIRRMLGRFPPK